MYIPAAPLLVFGNQLRIVEVQLNCVLFIWKDLLDRWQYVVICSKRTYPRCSDRTHLGGFKKSVVVINTILKHPTSRNLQLLQLKIT